MRNRPQTNEDVAADLYAMVQEFCTCNRKTGTRYTNYVENHDVTCGYRRTMDMQRTATREDGFTRV